MFFQIDDQLTNSRKHRELAEQAMAGDLRGPAAIGLWTMCGAQCQASLTDGVVSRQDAVRVFLAPQVVDDCAALLVQVGLWHAPGHDCARCVQPPADAWVFHDWFDLGYDRADQVTVTRRKRRELKDQKLINAVWARDCVDPATPTTAKCRYCSVVVNRKDTRSKGGRRPHLDHVDPTRADGARNIVIACEDCNRRKGNRTPEQADMVLLDPPRGDVGSPRTVEPPRPAPAGPAPTAAPGGAAIRPAAASGARHEVVSPLGSAAETHGSPLGGDAEPTPAPARRAGNTEVVSPGHADAETHNEVSPGEADAETTGSPAAADAEPTPRAAASGAHHEKVSPGHAAAETVHRISPDASDAEMPDRVGPVPARRDSPATAAAESPGVGTAPTTPPLGADQAPTTGRPRATTRGRTPGQPPSPPATTTGPRADHDPDHANEGVPARATYARVGQAGSGQGLGWGPGKGHGTAGSPPAGPPARSRRRRRGRGRGPRPSTPPAVPSPASPPTPGHQPSPPPAPEPADARWDAGHAPDVPTPGRFGSPWHGWHGPPSTVTETTCPDHDLPEPCRRCAATTGDADA